MARVNPGPTQRKRLLKANADRCCVCKRFGVGLHLDHIDEDPSNTVDANPAILCVEDHDRNHRPAAYRPKVNHLELGPEQIHQYKMSWEAFIVVQPNPKVVATLAAYGTVELSHSLQLVMQWPDEQIEYLRSFAFSAVKDHGMLAPNGQRTSYFLTCSARNPLPSSTRCTGRRAVSSTMGDWRNAKRNSWPRSDAGSENDPHLSGSPCPSKGHESR